MSRNPHDYHYGPRTGAESATEGPWTFTSREGLTIPRETWRYIFAGQALTGLMANRVNGEPVEKYSARAKRAADALLEALEKEPQE